MVEVWGMQSTPLLPLLPSLLWQGGLTPDRIQSMGQIELYDIQTDEADMQDTAGEAGTSS